MAKDIIQRVNKLAQREMAKKKEPPVASKSSERDATDVALKPELTLVDALERREKGLKPKLYVQRDFFVCDFTDVSLKDDIASMDAPIYSLSKNKDISEWRWSSKDGKNFIEVIPSVRGRATMFDKDVLIYLATQVTHGLNAERNDAGNRCVRFSAYDYFKATNKGTGGLEYNRLEDALTRLRGTTIKTNIATGGKIKTEGFGLIDHFKLVRDDSTNRLEAIEVTLSEWLYNAIQAHEVLTLHPDYFRLKKSLEKRFYEIARKFCGSKGVFVIGEEILYERSGSKASIRSFRQDALEIANADNLPDYRYSYNVQKRQWTIHAKDQKKLAMSLAALSNK